MALLCPGNGTVALGEKVSHGDRPHLYCHSHVWSPHRIPKDCTELYVCMVSFNPHNAEASISPLYTLGSRGTKRFINFPGDAGSSTDVCGVETHSISA